MSDKDSQKSTSTKVPEEDLPTDYEDEESESEQLFQRPYKNRASQHSEKLDSQPPLNTISCTQILIENEVTADSKRSHERNSGLSISYTPMESLALQRLQTIMKELEDLLTSIDKTGKSQKKNYKLIEGFIASHGQQYATGKVLEHLQKEKQEGECKEKPEQQDSSQEDSELQADFRQEEEQELESHEELEQVEVKESQYDLGQEQDKSPEELKFKERSQEEDNEASFGFSRAEVEYQIDESKESEQCWPLIYSLIDQEVKSLTRKFGQLKKVIKKAKFNKHFPDDRKCEEDLRLDFMVRFFLRPDVDASSDDLLHVQNICRFVCGSYEQKFKNTSLEFVLAFSQFIKITKRRNQDNPLEKMVGDCLELTQQAIKATQSEIDQLQQTKRVQEGRIKYEDQARLKQQKDEIEIIRKLDSQIQVRKYDTGSLCAQSSNIKQPEFQNQFKTKVSKRSQPKNISDVVPIANQIEKGSLRYSFIEYTEISETHTLEQCKKERKQQIRAISGNQGVFLVISSYFVNKAEINSTFQMLINAVFQRIEERGIISYLPLISITKLTCILEKIEGETNNIKRLRLLQVNLFKLLLENGNATLAICLYSYTACLEGQNRRQYCIKQAVQKTLAALEQSGHESCLNYSQLKKIVGKQETLLLLRCSTLHDFIDSNLALFGFLYQTLVEVCRQYKIDEEVLIDAQKRFHTFIKYLRNICRLTEIGQFKKEDRETIEKLLSSDYLEQSQRFQQACRGVYQVQQGQYESAKMIFDYLLSSIRACRSFQIEQDVFLKSTFYIIFDKADKNTLSISFKLILFQNIIRLLKIKKYGVTTILRALLRYTVEETGEMGPSFLKIVAHSLQDELKIGDYLITQTVRFPNNKALQPLKIATQRREQQIAQFLELVSSVEQSESYSRCSGFLEQLLFTYMFEEITLEPIFLSLVLQTSAQADRSVAINYVLQQCLLILNRAINQEAQGICLESMFDINQVDFALKLALNTARELDLISSVLILQSKMTTLIGSWTSLLKSQLLQQSPILQVDSSLNQAPLIELQKNVQEMAHRLLQSVNSSELFELYFCLACSKDQIKPLQLIHSFILEGLNSSSKTTEQEDLIEKRNKIERNLLLNLREIHDQRSEIQGELILALLTSFFVTLQLQRLQPSEKMLRLSLQILESEPCLRVLKIKAKNEGRAVARTRIEQESERFELMQKAVVNILPKLRAQTSQSLSTRGSCHARCQDFLAITAFLLVEIRSVF